MALRKALRERGLRYRLHAGDLPGKPDIVFRGKKVAIFVDGDFWHGRNWEERRRKLAQGANPDYWLQKIAYNMERDRSNTELLTGMGWRVLRYWERDVLGRAQSIAAEVHALLAEDERGRLRPASKAMANRPPALSAEE